MLLLLACLFTALAQPEPIVTIPSELHLADLQMLPDGRYLLVVAKQVPYEVGEVTLYDSRAPGGRVLDIGYRGPGLDVAIVQEGSWMVLSDRAARKVHRYNLDDGTLLPPIEVPFERRDLVASQDGRYIAVGTFVWDTVAERGVRFDLRDGWFVADQWFTVGPQLLCMRTAHLRRKNDKTVCYAPGGEKADVDPASLAREASFARRPAEEHALTGRDTLRVGAKGIFLVHRTLAFDQPNKVVPIAAEGMNPTALVTNDGLTDLVFVEGHIKGEIGKAQTPEVSFYHFPDFARLVEAKAPGIAGTCVEGDCRSGRGRWVMTDDNWYEGEFAGGVKEGEGVMVYGPYRYEGTFSAGRPAGQLRILTRDGAYIRDGLYRGGEYIGECLEGSCVLGEGVARYTDGTVVAGSFRWMRSVGEVDVRRPDGARLRGVVDQDAKLHGLVEITDSDEAGTWLFLHGDQAARCVSEQCRTGEVTYASGRKRLVVQVSEGIPHGRGTLTTDAMTFEGTYRAGRPTEGTVRRGDSSFTGTVGLDYKPVHGTIRQADGYAYEGPFLDGKPHGEGYLISPTGVRQRVRMKHGERAD